ncbi:hypothetical protein IJS77_01590 [bacterium]|nr:hypothetical protein [bacterium]
MIKKLLIGILLFIFSALPSYAGMQTTMERLMESWVGENIDSVINLWGQPTEEKISAERKFYCWNKNQDIIMGGFGIYGGAYGGTQTCNKIFEVDENNIIIRWSWSGNACPLTYYEVKKYVNPKNNYWKNKKEN